MNDVIYQPIQPGPKYEFHMGSDGNGKPVLMRFEIGKPNGPAFEATQAERDLWEQLHAGRKPQPQAQAQVEKSTLRDRFAMAALHGLVAQGVGDLTHGETAYSAYKYADAMMAERPEAQEDAQDGHA